MNTEQQRLQNTDWKKWGPYISERQWGTVREDYSANGEAWSSTTHEMARSKAWRWGEEGIAGICDNQQLLCFAISLWNKKDPILKERLFGLSGFEGNHGEDVKELYYYLDSSPTHSYMKMLYKYPQAAFPYAWLREENKRRTRLDPEFELIDTGIFDGDQYFDVFVEYAKASEEDLLIKITINNHSSQQASINILPTVWFRNTWSWGYDDYKPNLYAIQDHCIEIEHRSLGNFKLYCENNDSLLFCENETNCEKLYDHVTEIKYYKDGINEFIVNQNESSINPDRGGTKASVNYDIDIPCRQSKTIRLRLTKTVNDKPFDDFETLFNQRIQETNEFYNDLQKSINSEDEKTVQRQAFAGMLWSKQFYYYNVQQWLKGDPAQPPPPSERLKGRNADWKHVNCDNIISMPDKWEYPWFAAWDLCFHCLTFSLIDPAFAKKQLILLTKDWYMHPNGQLPAYEWSFGDTNPPVHAWAAYRVYEIDKQCNNGVGDTAFLETVFHKLIINFTWWVNRKDAEGNNIFEGGFLGMDNISLFDRDMQLPGNGHLEQSDGTSWMAMYSLNLMRMALELTKSNPVYQDMATKFFEHFLYIAGSMNSMGENNEGLWDDEDEFFYDVIRLPDNSVTKLKIRSMVGLIPLFAVEVLDDDLMNQPKFKERMLWFLDNRPELANLVSRWHEKGTDEKHLLSLLRGHRMKRILARMLDETEFLSDYGIRALSKYHEQHPFQLNVNGDTLSVAYSPGESTIPLFGGNSNWRGPVWMPVNYLIIESLQRFHHYYGDEFTVEYPTNSGQYLSLNDIGNELSKRISKLFLKDEHGKRAVFGNNQKLQDDPNFNNYVLFHEYFHGDNGKGLGASHQTGWTGLIAKILQPRGTK
ncbi:MAG: glucosidase [Bacteroidetes bacterium]|nr:glucosidase [Bacteroidota bacterium]